jgi:hypothetical protein
MRRIGALMGWSQTDLEFGSRFSSFVAGLTQRGWVEGRSIQIEQWWTDGLSILSELSPDRTTSFR